MSDTVTPFYFGPAEKQLFAIFYTPPPELARDFGVLICNPIGQEYVRAHRAMLQIALRLARLGFPVMRFDYYAQGDSTGADEQGRLAHWQDDVRAAVAELKRRGRVETVFFAGLRLGATLAALVAGGRNDVEGLALWEPVINGRDYLDELTVWHQDKLRYFLSGNPEGSSSNSGQARVKTEDANPPEILGFAFHPELIAELRSLDLLGLKRKPAGRLLIVNSEEQPSVEKFTQAAQNLGAEVVYHCIESFKMWTEDPDKGLVPQQTVQTIVDWLAEAGE